MGKSKRFRQFVAEDFYNEFREDKENRRFKRRDKNKYRRSDNDDDDDYTDEDYY